MLLSNSTVISGEDIVIVGDFFTWFFNNGLVIVQSTGIIVSLLFVALAFHRNTKANQLLVLQQITQSHRDLWINCYTSTSHLRVMDPNADPQSQPLSEEERRFIISLIYTSIIYTMLPGQVISASASMTFWI